MEALAALGATLLLGGLAVFQLLLAAGKPLGRYAWGGQHEVLPASLRIGSVISVALYAIFALVLLTDAGLIHVLDGFIFLDQAVWVITAYMFLGIPLNAISKSRPERLVMTPVVCCLFIASFIVALT